MAQALQAMRRQVRPGVTTAELDEVGARVFRQAGAHSGPQLAYVPHLAQPLTDGLVLTIER